MRTHRTTTRTAALATSVVLALGLAACSGSDDEQGSGDATTAAEETAPADESTADEGADEGDTQAEGASDDVCGATESLMDMSSTMSDVDPDDLQGTLDKLEELTTTLESVDNPPAEIADDWNTLATSFRSVTDGLSAAVEDPSDPDAMTEASDAMSVLTDQDFQGAAQSVSTYAAQNC